MCTSGFNQQDQLNAKMSALAYIPLDKLKSGIGLTEQEKEIIKYVGDAGYEVSVEDSLSVSPIIYENTSIIYPLGGPSLMPQEREGAASQMIVLINKDIGKATFAFKGTNNANEAVSDIANDGGAIWKMMSPKVDAVYKSLSDKYEIEATGHSLGAGMAATCCLKPKSRS